MQTRDNGRGCLAAEGIPLACLQTSCSWFKMWSCFVLAALFLGTAISTQQRAFKEDDRVHAGDKAAAPPYKVMYYDSQRVDHFDYRTYDVYSQKYLISGIQS